MTHGAAISVIFRASLTKFSAAALEEDLICSWVIALGTSPAFYIYMKGRTKTARVKEVKYRSSGVLLAFMPVAIEDNSEQNDVPANGAPNPLPT